MIGGRVELGIPALPHSHPAVSPPHSKVAKGTCCYRAGRNLQSHLKEDPHYRDKNVETQHWWNAVTKITHQTVAMTEPEFQCHSCPSCLLLAISNVVSFSLFESWWHWEFGGFFFWEFFFFNMTLKAEKERNLPLAFFFSLGGELPLHVPLCWLQGNTGGMQECNIKDHILLGGGFGECSVCGLPSFPVATEGRKTEQPQLGWLCKLRPIWEDRGRGKAPHSVWGPI